jgi:hypothetical protein
MIWTFSRMLSLTPRLEFHPFSCARQNVLKMIWTVVVKSMQYGFQVNPVNLCFSIGIWCEMYIHTCRLPTEHAWFVLGSFCGYLGCCFVSGRC